MKKIFEFMVAGQQYSAASLAKRLGMDVETVRAALDNLYEKKKIYRVNAAARSPRYTKPFPSRRGIAETSAQLEKRIVDAMGMGQWYQKDVAGLVHKSRDIVGVTMNRMVEKGVLGKKHVQNDRYLYYVLERPDHFEPECEDAVALKELVSQQWRGTPWQGLEVVL